MNHLGAKNKNQSTHKFWSLMSRLFSNNRQREIPFFVLDYPSSGSTTKLPSLSLRDINIHINIDFKKKQFYSMAIKASAGRTVGLNFVELPTSWVVDSKHFSQIVAIVDASLFSVVEDTFWA